MLRSRKKEEFSTKLFVLQLLICSIYAKFVGHLQLVRSAPLMARCGIILRRMYPTCLNLISMGFRQTCIPSFTEEGKYTLPNLSV